MNVTDIFPVQFSKFLWQLFLRTPPVGCIYTQDIEDVPNDQKDIVDYSKDSHEEKIRGNAQY